MAERRPWPLLVAAALVVLVLVVGLRAQRTLDAAALHARGESELQRGDAARAVADFRRALDRDPDHPDSWVALGGALEASGDTLAAIAVQESVVARAVREGWPFDAQVAARRSLGLRRYRAADWSGAIRDFEVIETRGAGSLETDLVLQIARLMQGDAAAVTEAMPALRRRYGDIEPLWKLGMAARAAERGSLPSRRTLEAFASLRATPDITALERAAGRDPIAAALLPAALLDASRASEATSRAAVLGAGPFASWGSLQAARAALASGALEKAAVEAAGLAADVSVPRETAYHLQAEVLQRQGQTAAARAAAARAVESNPASGRSLALLDALD